MITTILKDLMIQKLGVLRPSSKGWVKRNCMLCHTQGHGVDKRLRFGVKFEEREITCNCFNCGFSAHWEEGKPLNKNFRFFLKNIGVDEKFIKQLEFDIFKIRYQLEGKKDDKLRGLFNKWPVIELPEGSLPITTWLENNCNDTNFLEVVNYAIGRKIYDLDEFYWCPSRSHSLNKRLMIPYYHKGQIVGYTARYAEDLEDKRIPKYHQHCPEDFVYNCDPQEDWQRKYTIVTEGVLDAWVVGGVSILGEVNQEKIDVINRLQKVVIVCPDKDKKGSDLAQVAINNDWYISIPNWDVNIKDASQAAQKYGRLLTTHSIIASAIKGNVKKQINWRIKENERNKRL